MLSKEMSTISMGTLKIKSLLFLSCIVVAMSTFNMRGEFKGLENSIIKAIDSNYQGTTTSLSINNLDNETARYYSGTPNKSIGGVFIEIDIKGDGLSQNDKDDLVVYTLRSVSGFSKAYPTVFKVMGMFEDVEKWQPLFNVDLQFRGEGTHEYSIRIPVNKIWCRSLTDEENPDEQTLLSLRNGKRLLKMRFYVISNSENNYGYSSGTGLHPVDMNRFDVIKIAREESYSSIFRDSQHLNTDFRYNFKDYRFVRTDGILDSRNKIEGWNPPTKDECKALGIDYVDFTTESNGLQPTHTVEHIIYAMPGDVISLIPYYNLPTYTNFNENFSHWYSEKSRSGLRYSPSWSNETFDLLDFATNPENIQVSEDAGFYGGMYMNAGAKKIYRISTAEEYKAAVEAINSNSKQNYYVELLNDIDFCEEGTDTPREDIPILGWPYSNRFWGTFNGNGHKISNLVYDKPSEVGIGLVGYTQGAVIENIVLDKSCKFIGNRRVGGIIGECEDGETIIRNIHTEATVIGVNSSGEQAAAGLIGLSPATANLSITIENCYVGGQIGDRETNHKDSNNAAIMAWFGSAGTNMKGTFRNILVECNLTGYETSNPYKKYIRNNQNQNVITNEDNDISHKGNMTFQNCYGCIDYFDLNWHYYKKNLPTTDEIIPNLSGWTDFCTPPKENKKYESSYSEPGYSKTYLVTDATQYITAVNEINEKLYENACIILTGPIDFSNMTVPMIYEGKDWKRFRGCINGNGYTMSNLHINKPSTNNVGLVSWGGEGLKILNLTIDSTCIIDGNENVGLIGRFYGGQLTISNVSMCADVICHNKYSAAIGGFCSWEQGNHKLEITNVYIGSNIINPSHNGCLFGRLPVNEVTNTSTFSNIVVNCKVDYVTSPELNQYINCENYLSQSINSSESKVVRTLYNSKGSFAMEFVNCYGILDFADNAFEAYGNNAILNSDIISWGEKYEPKISHSNISNLSLIKDGWSGYSDRTSGTSATFYCPRDPFKNASEQSLPFEEGESEYVIIADFSQTFDPNVHIVSNEKEIIEPIIATRHIFRIRDGKTYADNMSGRVSETGINKNDNYRRLKRKYVSARANVPFQIALDSPLPAKDDGAKSNYYYKFADRLYDRVRKCKIEVYNGDTKELVSNFFSFGQPLNSQGKRVITHISGSNSKDVNYQIADGDRSFNRMLVASNPQKGHYIVRITGYHDDNSTEIKDPVSQEPIVLMEYDIRFLPKEGASMVPLDKVYESKKGDDGELTYEWEHTWDETLTNKYGEPFVINFDEYAKINKSDKDTKEKLVSEVKIIQSGDDENETSNAFRTYYKWPLPWDRSDYSFGYNKRQDFNMYMIASHSSNVPYHVAARNFTGNRAGDGKGLYDVSYYKSMPEYNRDKIDKPTQGYFYYVNAASDPGVSARLRIEDLCQGSTIIVSAWMSEFSQDQETANLSFNFVAVMKDDEEYNSLIIDAGVNPGDRLTLHKFITGYIPGEESLKLGSTSVSENNSKDARGKWLNVYYSFVPRLTEFSSNGIASEWVDHYELELDNNDKSSSGADYAIDDIKCWVVPPSVETKQLTPLCKEVPMRLRLASPFETLLEIANQSETTGETNGQPTKGEDLDVYYTLLKKNVFDEIYDENIEDSYIEAFREAVLPFHYNREGSGASYGTEFNGESTAAEHYFGKITFNSNYKCIPTYTENNTGFGKALAWTQPGENRTIVLESQLPDNIFKEYERFYVVFKSMPKWSSESKYEPSDEDIESGKLADFFDMLGECANTCESQILGTFIYKINGEIESDLEKVTFCENQSPVVQVNVRGYDEYHEPVNAQTNAYFDWFLGTKEEYLNYGVDEGHPLKEALGVFRNKYPENATLEGIYADEEKMEGEEMLEQWMIDIIRKASSSTKESPEAPLTLYMSSYVMPAKSIPEGMNEAEGKVVVIPIQCTPDETAKYLVCADEEELTLHYAYRSPKLKHGLLGITYPEVIEDVPLRIGLDQLRDEMAKSPYTKSPKTIRIPLRLVSTTDSRIQQLIRVKDGGIFNDATQGKEGCVVLVQTNDPEYKDLGTFDNKGNDTGCLKWIGEVRKIEAKTGSEATGNYFDVEFDKDFIFKEGYFYKMRFQYGEDTSAFEDSSGDGTTSCYGQDVFTIKVVPKYVQWTGAENLNWNNDANWRRINKVELHTSSPAANANYLYDAMRSSKIVNGNVNAYAPLDFTNVIVGDENEAPYLYSSPTQSVNDIHGNIHQWPEDASPKEEWSVHEDWNPERVGLPTELVEYDMAAFYTDGATMKKVGCRPWYANSCNEVHFLPGGTVMNQQELNYNKAWVDVELNPSRWYLLSTPLKEVYAGDFYLPAKGRQMTELFKDITFSSSNNRFKPAVFQRGWDKSQALVYKWESEDVENVAIRTFWSHVYNDVEEQYGGGTGFSIMTDVSSLTGFSDKVLFRLPKADTEYYYYTEDYTTSNNHRGDKTIINRSDAQYRLNDSHGSVLSSTATEGNYFLVGNPVMTHFDIGKFIKENEEILEPKFWIVTETGQHSGVFDNFWNLSVTTTGSEDAANIDMAAPMQGFFVKTRIPAMSVSLKYDESMMRRYGSDGFELSGVTRSEESRSLRISAFTDGHQSTSASLVVGLDGSEMDVEAIDNRDLDLPSTVYTVKNGHAQSICFCDNAEGMEIGVLAEEDTMTELRFEGREHGLFLYDRLNGGLIPIEDGMSYEVEGAVSGRLYLTYAEADEVHPGGIYWQVLNEELYVENRADTGILKVKIYDIMGRNVNSAVDEEFVNIRLGRGIYVVEMDNGIEKKAIKIKL